MKPISKFIYNMYIMKKIKLEKIKKIIKFKNLQDDFKVVKNINNNDIKIVENSYVLTKNEMYLKESDFF